VSSYLHEVVVPGDELEVRGPIGAGSCGVVTHRPCSSAGDRASCPPFHFGPDAPGGGPSPFFFFKGPPGADRGTF